ncbi:hypothetical protein [Achromobacter phage maay_LB1]|nr:hypothetical protein [Achromobacter phage maay_LB1]WNO48993.1 hypothetical protein [Achromobacter phage emuu_LB7]WNO49058.1 hypothetical protein [Achromobacter phage ehaak_LB5]
MIGLRAINDAYTFQIDPSYNNLVARGPKTAWGRLTPGDPFVTNSPPPAGTTARSIIVSDNLDDSAYFGWNWGYCWLFQSAAEGGHPAVSGIPGLRVRNESTGQIVWQHNLRALRVVDAVYNAQGGWSKAYPAGRVYRLAPLSWGGLSEIRDVGDAGMGDGSRLYQQYWRTCYWNINNNVVSIRQVQESDQEIFDGPAGLAGIVGMTPHLSFLVVDMTNFP